jgi:hypothetical protein
VDFRFHLSFSERGEWQCGKPISRLEQMGHPAALHLRPQQGF